MPRFLAVKQLGVLRPVDEAGKSALSAVDNGAVVEVEVRGKRRMKHHRLYWALISKVWENIDHDDFPTPENLSDTVKLITGHREQLMLPDGTFSYKPASIAFHKMDQAQFSDFYDRVCDLMVRRFLPGVTNEQLRHEVEVMCGAAA